MEPMPCRDRSFFAEDPRDVARGMLGDTLVHALDGRRLAGRIVETEAYLGPDDPASHARHGPTDRTKVMWARPGTLYVYRIYGIHAMLNLVTRPEGTASAVLVRAVRPTEGVEAMRRRRGSPDRRVDLTNGPGKLCEALGVTVGMTGGDATRGDLVVEPGPAPDRMEATGRVGVVEDVEEPRRYVVGGSDWASR